MPIFNTYLPKVNQLLLLAFFCCQLASAQFYNKEVKAEITVEENSEFYTFKALAENLTPSNYNLRYEFLVFKKDNQGNTSKSSQGNRFYLEANQKTVLATSAINYNEDGKIIIALIIYDEDNKPIGQDRKELADGGQTALKDIPKEELVPTSQDQAKPQDGVVFNGLLLENTITKAGRDFFRYFSQDFLLREIRTTKNIVIDEVPGRGRNTLITVKVEGTLVWQFFSQARKEFLKEMEEIAMARAILQLQRLNQQSEQFTKY